MASSFPCSCYSKERLTVTTLGSASLVSLMYFTPQTVTGQVDTATVLYQQSSVMGSYYPFDITILEPIPPPASLSAHMYAWSFCPTLQAIMGDLVVLALSPVTGSLSPFFIWTRKTLRYFVLNRLAVLSPMPYLWTASAFPFSAAYFQISALSSGWMSSYISSFSSQVELHLLVALSAYFPLLC